MRALTFSAIALLADTALGYLNTSPFFLFSTSPNFRSASITNVEHASSIDDEVTRSLSLCPSEYYIVVLQPGVSTSDYMNSKNTPTLNSNLIGGDNRIRSKFIAAEILGEVNSNSWEQSLMKTCNLSPLRFDAKAGSIPPLSSSHKLLSISFPAPSPSSKAAELSDNDKYLASVLELIPSHNYTILYTTTSTAHRTNIVPDNDSDDKQYEMEPPFFDFPHTELRRALSSGKRQDDNQSNITLIDGPLFERYQFFTPGIWMSFLVAFLLLLILYVGVSALAGLQVTYAAFEKESGPLAGKKSQ